MEQKRYWLRGLMIGIILVGIQTVLYLSCLPTEQGPYGFCGIIFAFPFGIFIDDLLSKVQIIQLRIPIVIILEIVVIGGGLAIAGYVYGKIKNSIKTGQTIK